MLYCPNVTRDINVKVTVKCCIVLMSQGYKCQDICQVLYCPNVTRDINVKVTVKCCIVLMSPGI